MDKETERKVEAHTKVSMEAFDKGFILGILKEKFEWVKKIREDIEYQEKQLTGDFDRDRPTNWRIIGMKRLLK